MQPTWESPRSGSGSEQDWPPAQPEPLPGCPLLPLIHFLLPTAGLVCTHGSFSSFASRVTFWHGLSHISSADASFLSLVSSPRKAKRVWYVVSRNVVLLAAILLLVHDQPSAETTSCLSHVFTIPVLSNHLHPFTHPLCGLGAQGPPSAAQRDALGKPPSSQDHLFAFLPKQCVNK